MSHPRAAWGSTGEKRFATTDTLPDKFLIEYADALDLAQDATYDFAFDPDFLPSPYAFRKTVTPTA